jgi:superfamily II DNA/RNA helicase
MLLSSEPDETMKPHVVMVLEKSTKPIESLQGSILIGTPSFLLELIKLSHVEVLNQVNYIVLDEVDRLLSVLGKYATYTDKVTKDASMRPTQSLLEKIVELRSKSDNMNEVQIIAASATVGRPLRRELYKMLDPGLKYGDGYHVIRANQNADVATELPSESKSNRAVSIPATIKHMAILRSDDTDEFGQRDSPLSDGTITKKIIIIKNLWETEFKTASRAMLFVPTNDDAKQVVGMMKYWGLENVVNLQESIDVSRSNINGVISDEREGPLGMTVKSRKSENLKKEQTKREIFVISVSGARGLHIKDVDCVLVLMLPKNMDEYLHMAGRTGRYGNKRLDGTVISVVDFDELKKLQSWQTALGISVDVKYK